MPSETDILFAASTGGFYTPVVHGAAIPGDAVLITADQHRALIAATTDGATISGGPDGYPVANWPAPPTDAEALASARAAATKHLLDWISAATAPLTAKYSDTERSMWPAKLPAAQRIIAGGGTSFDEDFFSAEAALAGVSIAACAAATDEKGGAFVRIASAMSGLRQSLEAALATAKTAADVPKMLTAVMADAEDIAEKSGLPIPDGTLKP